MGSVILQKVAHQYGGQIVLSEVSCEVRTGEIVGLVGPNGAGKTTLLRIVAGFLTPETGNVTRSRGLRIGYLAQEPDLSPDRTLRAEVENALAHVDAWERELHAVSDAMAAATRDDQRAALMRDYDRLHAQIETAGGYRRGERIGELLGGFGFSQADHDMPVGLLSGGQKCRAALAKLLLGDDDLLLLDEPTNHLDLDAVRFLERFLAGHRGGALIVSHDRYLLDRVCTRILEVDRTHVRSFTGNYSTYVATRERERLTQERQQEKDAEFIRKERAFIAQHLAGQRSREAKGRRTRLQRQLADGGFVLEKPNTPAALKLAFDHVERIGGTVLRTNALGKGFSDNALFANLNLIIDAGACCGIVGANGTGKTTLLRVLRGEMEADAGHYTLHSRAQVGYFAQEAENLSDEHTPLETVLAAHGGLGEQRVRDLLARFGFRGEAVFKRCAQLSGGEQSRLRLLLLLLDAPNLLLLDEPTNHLDVAAREALEAALADYPGTVIAVSHDRYFLDRLVDQLLVLSPGEHEVHAGDYSSYVAAREERKVAGRSSIAKPKRRRTEPNAPAADKRPSPTAAYDALSIDEIEALIIEREERVAGLHARYASEDVYRNAAALGELQSELASVQDELSVLHAAWDERADNH